MTKYITKEKLCTSFKQAKLSFLFYFFLFGNRLLSDFLRVSFLFALIFFFNNFNNDENYNDGEDDDNDDDNKPYFICLKNFSFLFFVK